MHLRSFAALPVGVLLTLAFPLTAQTPLHLIPMPREVKPASVIPLSSGIQVNCAQPCDPDDAFAIADLQQTLAGRGIPVSASASAPHIFITRQSSSIGRAIYNGILPASGANRAGGFPPEMRSEGYAIVPDGNGPRDAGLAVTAETSAGILYALQTVKQLIVGDGAADRSNSHAQTAGR